MYIMNYRVNRNSIKSIYIVLLVVGKIESMLLAIGYVRETED